MSHFLDALNEWLQPPDSGTPRCVHCRVNLDDPGHELNTPCAATIETEAPVCAVCCTEYAAIPCKECLEIVDEHLPGIPTGPNHNQPTWTATGPVGTHLPRVPPEFEACDECDQLFEVAALTRIRTEDGAALACWPCIDRRRDMGLAS